MLRKVFYTVPSRLIGHHLRGRVYDDRIDLFLGASFLLTLPRGRATRHGPHKHVVSYHHVIHSLRKKPMALIGLVYRDQIFPRQAFRDLFDMMLAQTTDRQACVISSRLSRYTLARRIGVVLHRMWRNETEFRFARDVVTTATGV